MNLPNKLTIFRILLVPIIVIIPFFNISGTFLNIPYTYWIINIIFIIASITDILVLATMLILVEFGKLPAWIPIIVLAREFIISGYRLIAVEKGGKVIAASFWGKLKTATQMIAIVLAFLDLNAFGAFLTTELTGVNLAINILATILMFISVVATIFSGWDYLKGSKELFKD